MITEISIKNYRFFKGKHAFSFVSTKDEDLSEWNTFEVVKNSVFLRPLSFTGPMRVESQFPLRSLLFNFPSISGHRQQEEDSNRNRPISFLIVDILFPTVIHKSFRVPYVLALVTNLPGQ
jgi:hypothetical protein